MAATGTMRATETTPSGGFRTPRARNNLLKRIWRSRIAAAGLSILVVLAFLAMAAPLLTAYDPVKISPRDALLVPSGQHLFGTDQYGRDVFSRVVFGTRISLMVGFISVSIAVVIGTLIGLLAGFYGGWVDTILMRFVDVMLAFPGISARTSTREHPRS